MINIQVLSERAVKGQDFKDALVISITSPGQEHPKIKGSHIHRFHFHDVTEIYEMSDGRLIQPMSKTIAEAIVDLGMCHRHCDEWIIHCEEWIIHCEAGISRSPAVAIGLSKYLKFNPNRRNLKKMFPMYNKYIAGFIEEAMDIRYGDPSSILY